jgi:hypothetical protein
MNQQNKVIVAGSRTFTNYAILSEVLDKYLPVNASIISGTARGADKLGERYAEENNITLTKFPADWNKYGKSAGPLRNREMADIAHTAIIFWDGHSKGTLDMIEVSKSKNLDLIVIRYREYEGSTYYIVETKTSIQHQTLKQ